MKKVFSIFLSIIMLVAVLHFSVATHYCGGIEAASKVSLTGKLAECGMEKSVEVPLSGTNFSRHCCDNYVIYCGINSNYAPSFSLIPDSFQDNFQILAIPVELSVNSDIDLIPLYTDTSPSAAFRSTDVDLSDICVFRI